MHAGSIDSTNANDKVAVPPVPGVIVTQSSAGAAQWAHCRAAYHSNTPHNIINTVTASLNRRTTASHVTTMVSSSQTAGLIVTPAAWSDGAASHVCLQQLNMSFLIALKPCCICAAGFGFLMTFLR
jgi:hypothetical protein